MMKHQTIVTIIVYSIGHHVKEPLSVIKYIQFAHQNVG